jgi:hypothetical protein
MSNPSKPLKLTARQYQLLLHLLENLLDVSTDPGVRRDAAMLLKKLEASR